MKRTISLTVLVVILASAVLIFYYRITSNDKTNGTEFAETKQGKFEISVTNTGELIPERSMDIRGPDIIRNKFFRVAPVRITDLLPEGTMVKKGDYIATLDRSNYDNTLKDEIAKLTQLESDYRMKLLDTAVVLNTLRDDIKNQLFEVEEAKLTVAESKYEPPATKRLNAMELDKAGRVLEQKRKLYTLNLAQTSLETKSLRQSLREQNDRVKDLQALLGTFTITSPADGMLTYKKDRTGNKIKTGSMWMPFDPVIATLPDFSSFDSKTYISEIDVSKVKKELTVEVGIDALSGKTMYGKVESIANIGEILPNSDSKVFEVMIRLDESDPSLKPSMTTTNKIIIAKFDNVVFVPLEAVHAGPDSIPYVYTRDRKKQVILPGLANDKNIIVEKGLEAGIPVFLEIPEKAEKFTMAGIDLIPQIRERNRAKRKDFDNAMKEPRIIAESGKLSPE